MKHRSRRLPLVILLLVLGLQLPLGPIQARPLAQSVSLQATVTGPDAEGYYRVAGTVSASGFAPDESGHTHYSNSLSVIVQFIGPNGRWPELPDAYSIGAACPLRGDACLSPEEAAGDLAGSASVFGASLNRADDGKRYSFDERIEPPQGAVQMRVLAHLDHTFSATGAAWPGLRDYWDVQGPMALADVPPGDGSQTPPATDTPKPDDSTLTPTVTPTLTPTPEGCRVDLTPSPAYVQPGHEVTLSGKAVGDDGQPLAGAAIFVETGGMDGSANISQSFTNKAGHFTVLYGAPQDPGGSTGDTLTVQVAGCSQAGTVAITFGSPPTATPTPLPTTTASPTPTPTATGAVSPTPTPTATPADEDLAIARVVLLQAVEGGKLVSGRDVGARVFFTWSGAQPAEVDVAVTVDGQPQTPVRGQVEAAPDAMDRFLGRDAINVILPADLWPWPSGGNHTLEIHARLLNATDRDPSNNRHTESFTTHYAWMPDVLFVSAHPSLGYGQLMGFAASARRFMEQVYPVPWVRVIPNAAYLAQHVTGTAWGTAAAVEQARQRYNAERCHTADGQPIPNCTAPYAGIAVGAFPSGHFGACKEGFLYGSGGNLLKDEMAKMVYGPTIDRAAMCSIQNPLTAAHEVGHHFGLGDDYGSNSLGVALQSGVSIWRNGRFQTQDPGGGRQLDPCYSFMGNAGEGMATSPGCSVARCTWVDARTWNALLGRTGIAQAPPRALVAAAGFGTAVDLPRAEGDVNEVEGAALMVAAHLADDGSATMTSVTLLKRYEAISLVAGDWALAAVDAEGKAVSTLAFQPIADDQFPGTPIVVTLPAADPSAVTAVQLSHQGAVVARLARSAASPTVTLDPMPDLSAPDPVLRWQADDADGDALTYDVFYSTDGGHRWQMLALSTADTALPLDPSTLSGGNAQFRVVANDGFNTGSAASAPTAIPERGPSARITTPWGDTFAWDEPVVLMGSGYDPEDGLVPDAALQWTTDEGRELGTGGQLTVRDLAPGDHRITLTVRDTAGQTGRTETTVTISARTIGDHLTGLLGGLTLGWPVLATGSAILLTTVGSVVLSVWGLARLRDPGLRAMKLQADATRQYVRAGRMRPAHVRMVQGRDRRGRAWQLDPMNRRWAVWRGRRWEWKRSPLKRRRRLLWIGLAGLALSLVAALALLVLSALSGGALSSLLFGALVMSQQH